MHDYQVADTIIAVIAEMAGLKSPKRIRSTDRSPAIVRMRDTCAYLIRMNTQLSFPEIGRCFGGKDHSSIMSAVKREILRLERGVPNCKAQHVQVMDLVKKKIAETVGNAIAGISNEDCKQCGVEAAGKVG